MRGLLRSTQAIQHLAEASGSRSAARATFTTASSSARFCSRCAYPGVFMNKLPSGKLSRRSQRHFELDRRTYASAPITVSVPADPVTLSEDRQRKLLETVAVKVQQNRIAMQQEADSMTVEEQKERAQVLKETGTFATLWDEYERLRKTIRETEAGLKDPDPSLREMFEAELPELIGEMDQLLDTRLPQMLLPPLLTAGLPMVMTVMCGIGGGEAARFAEELSVMYRRFAEKRGWKTEVLSSVEGPPAKGSGGNGYREITMRFNLGEFSEEGAECFGLFMWEKGVHRVQRTPPGATVNKLQTSTANVTLLPIYPDTEDQPLFDVKDVKQEVMRARGAGGQHVNKTESAVRLTHIPTGITVSMQDSRSQHQNRMWAWEVLRGRLSERRRAEEQEAQSAVRLSQVKSGNRSDKVRTYNFQQDRVTDHRIGFSAGNLEGILAGEGLMIMIDALKQDLAERRLEALMLGEPDLIE